VHVLQICHVLAYLLIIVCADDVTTASRDIYLFYVYGVTVLSIFGFSRPDLSYFFANPDKIGNKLIFAVYDSKYILKYIWRVPHLEVHGK